MDCYNCRFRDKIPGDAHIRCTAIKSVATPEKLVMLELLLSIGKVELINKETSEPLVKLNAHGVKRGWAAWPLNFDPCWVEACEFFIKKD